MPPGALGAAPGPFDGPRSRNDALRTRQFYLLWGILFINVTAGIGILAQASPMMQDMFKRTPLQAAAVVSLISIFNAGGRFMWASASDYIGRRNTYATFFLAHIPESRYRVLLWLDAVSRDQVVLGVQPLEL